MYALGNRINDPVISDLSSTPLSSARLTKQANKLIQECNTKGKQKIHFTTALVWIRTAIRLAKRVEELEHGKN